MLHLLIALAFNLVPLAGVLYFGWSAGTVLALYWFESLFGHFGAMIKIRLHATTNKRGHTHYTPAGDKMKSGGSYFGHYSTIALLFTFAHGFFLGIILLMLSINRPDLVAFHLRFDDLITGIMVIGALAAMDVIVDLPTLRQKSFLWLEIHTGKRLAQVLVMHLTLIFGMAAVAWFESEMALLYVLIGLKTLIDAMTRASNEDMKVDEGFDTPVPGWLRWLDKHLPENPARKGKKKESLDEYWKRADQDEIHRRKRHEAVIGG
jgi:hypothetical protein